MGSIALRHALLSAVVLAVLPASARAGEASTPPPALVVTLAGPELPNPWGARTCAYLRGAFAGVLGGVRCALLSGERTADELRAVLAPTEAATIFLHVLRAPEGDLHFALTRDDLREEGQLEHGWMDVEADHAQWLALREAVLRVAGPVQRPEERLTPEEAFQRSAVIVGLAEVPSRRLLLDDEGRLRSKVDRRLLATEEAFDLLRGELPERRRFSRAVLTTLGFIGFGIGWYYIDQRTNAQDWDFPFAWDTFRRKLTGEYLRFEDNNFYHNAFGHVLAGAMYHNAFRSNGFTSLESFAGGVLATLIWEYVVEYREVASINDLIVSPIAGSALGESMHWLSLALLTEPSNTPRRIAAAFFNPTLTLNRVLDRDDPRPLDDIERFLRSRGVWPTMELVTAGGIGSFREADYIRVGFDVDFRARLAGHRDADRVGELGELMFDPPRMQLDLGVSFGELPFFHGLRIFTKYSWAGYFERSLGLLPSGGLSGYTLYFGGATAFQHRTHRLVGRVDQLGIVNVAGPTFELRLIRGPLVVRLAGDAFFDFAMLRAMALDGFRAVDTLEGTKSVLKNRGYYYAFGATVRGELTGELGPFELGFAGEYHTFDSIEGLDRFQEDVTRDFSITDQRSGLSGWFRWRTPAERISVGALYEELRFSGQMLQVEDRERERRLRALVSVAL